MAGGIYAALSGLQSRYTRLDRLAADIANAGTSGYKAGRHTTVAADRQSFSDTLDSAVDVVASESRVDFRPGALAPTGRDLDLAIDGPGFFEIQTPAGTRYTRNGNFTRRTDGTLATSHGEAVLGQAGPIVLPQGKVDITADGTISVAGKVVGRARVVEFDDPDRLTPEEGVRFRAPNGVTGTEAVNSGVRAGVLEDSNVSLPERMVQLTEVSRGFEALQRGISVLMNDIDGRAITELGRR